MKKINLLKWGFLCLFCMLTTMSWAAAGGDEFTISLTDDVYCTFGSSNAVNASQTGFFNTGSEDSFSTGQGRGIAYINGETYDYYLKLEGSTQFTITLPASMTITMLFSDEDSSDAQHTEVDFLLDGTDITVTANDDGNFVYTATLDEGDHIIKRNQTQYYIFYIGLSYVNSGDKTYSAAQWDWYNNIPEGIREIGYELSDGEVNAISGSVEYIDSDVDGIKMCIDANHDDGVDRKFKVNGDGSNVQVNASTILRVPVVNEGDVVTITRYPDNFSCTVGSNAETATFTDNVCTYEANESDVECGYVEIISGGGYLYSVKVEYVTALTSEDIENIDYDKIGGTTEDEQGDDDGIIAVTIDDEDGVSYEVTAGETAYFSFTIPEEAGTLSIVGSIDVLYTDKDCTVTAEEGNCTSYSPYTYAYSTLTPGETYYGKITYSVLGTNSGTIKATYETTGGDDNNGGSGDYTITLTSPTAEEIATNGLSDGTITLSSDIPYGAGIMFELYADDAENAAYSNWFTPETQTTGEGEDAVTTYTGTFTYEWDSSIMELYEIPEGTYTFKVTAYTTNNNKNSDVLVATQDLFTFNYEVEDKVTATLTAKPENEATITTTGSEQTIELTFSSEVKIKLAEISLSGGNYDTNVTVSEGDEASTTWTLTITDEQLQSAISDRSGALSIIIYATDAEGNDVYTEDEMTFFELDYTVEGGTTGDEISWSDIEVETVTVGSEGKALGEGMTTDDSIFTVTFTDGDQAAEVTVIDDNTAEYYSYITVGDNNYALTATADETPSSSWTLTIPETAMEAIAAAVESDDECAITLVVVAQDDNGYYVKSSFSSDFPTYQSTVVASSGSGESGDETPYTFDSDPYDGETVESLSSFSVTIDDSEDEGAFIEIAGDYEDIKVYAADENGDPTGDAVTAVGSDDPDPIYHDSVDEDYNIGFTFTLDTPVTEQGDYVIVIPEGFFYCGSLTNMSLQKTIHFTVQQAVDYDLTITPADGAEVESLASITIIETNGQELLLNGYEDDIVVLDADGNTITTGKEWGASEEGNTMTDASGAEIGYIIPLESTITAAGTYTIVIPEEFVLYGDWDAAGNAEIKITVTVTGDADESGDGNEGDGTEGDGTEEATEICLYTTDFTDWTATSGYTDSSYSVTTESNENLTFILTGIQVDPTGYNSDNKFSQVGYLVIAKTEGSSIQYSDGATSIITSALDSITKVVFTEAVTGSSRGFELSISTDGGETWTSVFSSTIGTGATEQTVEINKANCQLKFTNLNEEQNAYLTDLSIYGVATSSDEGTDGIKNVTLRATGDDRFYNLNGQRVTTPTHGIYILNGKKVLIK